MNKPEPPTAIRPGVFRMHRSVFLRIFGPAVLFLLVFLGDGLIRQVVQDYRTPEFNRWMRMLTMLGWGSILSGAALTIYGMGFFRNRPRWREAGLRGLIALGAAGILVQIIKHLTGRPRPRLADEGVGAWGPSLESGHDSFPSGHTISAFAFAAVLSAAFPAGRRIWYSTAVAVGLSRIYLDAHYASDVMAGAVLGWWIGVRVFRLKLERAT